MTLSDIEVKRGKKFSGRANKLWNLWLRDAVKARITSNLTPLCSQIVLHLPSLQKHSSGSRTAGFQYHDTMNFGESNKRSCCIS